MKDHHKLSLQQPELTSLARVSGHKKVHTIFDVLENIVDEIKITCSRIFNMDGTSHTVVQHPEKIISQKGNDHVGAISLCEQGQNVTGLYAVKCECFLFFLQCCFSSEMDKDIHMENPQALLPIVKTKAGWIFKCSVNGSVISSQL